VSVKRKDTTPFSVPARVSGDGFALRNLCQRQHHRCDIAVQNLLARSVADLRVRKRLAGSRAAESPEACAFLNSSPRKGGPIASREQTF
jgi:hypothetical protein